MTTDQIIETETCTRCHGSGQYSYCQDYGTKCFKCRGKGVQRTKRGEAVSRWVTEQRRTDVSEVAVGDRITFDDIHPAGTRRVTITVSAIREDAPIHGRSMRDGVWTDWTQRSFTLTSAEGREYGFCGSISVYRAVTDELREAARQYRDSLTKAGKPRKTKAAA